MAATSRVVGFDIEAAQAGLGPVDAIPLHGLHLLGAFDVSQEHDGTETGKPIRPEPLEGNGIDHGIGVSLFDLLVQLIRQIDQQGPGHIGRGREGDQRRDGDPVPESDLARRDRGRQLSIRGYHGGRWILERGGHRALSPVTGLLSRLVCGTGTWPELRFMAGKVVQGRST